MRYEIKKEIKLYCKNGDIITGKVGNIIRCNGKVFLNNKEIYGNRSIFKKNIEYFKELPEYNITNLTILAKKITITFDKLPKIDKSQKDSMRKLIETMLNI